MSDSTNIYSPDHVRKLFDEMSETYGFVNYVSSFGFVKRWRKQCVQQVPISTGMTVYDLMTGMGECWHLILPGIGRTGQLMAIDLSPHMLEKAGDRLQKLDEYQIESFLVDVLDNDIPDVTADVIISAFGLKTFSLTQQELFAKEMKRILKPGGEFSLIEISVPANLLLRTLYMFYLKYIIPIIGKVFMGNPDNYRMLGIYTGNFKNCARLRDMLVKNGLRVKEHSYFWGCATGLVGAKPQQGAD